MSLIGKLISNSYQSLLKVVADTGLVTGVKQRVQDGKGTNTALEIGTDGINIDGDLEVGGTRRITPSGQLVNVSGNISQFTNDAGYLDILPADIIRSGDNITDLNNNAGYITSGDTPQNLSELNDDINNIVSGDSISKLNNDVGFITSGDTPQNLSELNDDINNIVSGDSISKLNNDVGFVTGDTSLWDEGYNNSVSGLSVSGSNLVVERPSGNLSVSLPTTSGGTPSGGGNFNVLPAASNKVYGNPYNSTAMVTANGFGRRLIMSNVFLPAGTYDELVCLRVTAGSVGDLHKMALYNADTTKYAIENNPYNIFQPTTKIAEVSVPADGTGYTRVSLSSPFTITSPGWYIQAYMYDNGVDQDMSGKISTQEGGAYRFAGHYLAGLPLDADIVFIANTVSVSDLLISNVNDLGVFPADLTSRTTGWSSTSIRAGYSWVAQ